MSIGRLCVAAALFFAATYIHVFLPLWAQTAQEKLFYALDKQGFVITAEETAALEEIWGYIHD